MRVFPSCYLFVICILCILHLFWPLLLKKKCMIVKCWLYINTVYTPTKKATKTITDNRPGPRCVLLKSYKLSLWHTHTLSPAPSAGNPGLKLHYFCSVQPLDKPRQCDYDRVCVLQWYRVTFSTGARCKRGSPLSFCSGCTPSLWPSSAKSTRALGFPRRRAWYISSSCSIWPSDRLWEENGN